MQKLHLGVSAPAIIRAQGYNEPPGESSTN